MPGASVVARGKRYLAGTLRPPSRPGSSSGDGETWLYRVVPSDETCLATATGIFGLLPGLRCLGALPPPVTDRRVLLALAGLSGPTGPRSPPSAPGEGAPALAPASQAPGRRRPPAGSRAGHRKNRAWTGTTPGPPDLPRTNHSS